MDEETGMPWWRGPLRAIGFFVALVALSAVMMGGVLLVARFLDKPNAPLVAAPIHIDISSPPPQEQNARTRAASTHGFDIMINSPGRPAGVSFKGNTHGSKGGNHPGAVETAAPAVGLSDDEYRAAVDSGKKLYLPNPKGECDLSGASVSKSAGTLENCFARQAAR